MNLLYKYLKAAITRNEIFHITFFVTGMCNLKCKMCFYLDNIHKAEKEKELSLDEIHKISKNIHPFVWLLISGGEPFIRDDLVEICEIFYKQNKVNNITIPTNGFLTEKIVRNIKDICRICKGTYINLDLSLNGLEKEHDEICGRQGAFNHLVETAFLINDLRKEVKNLGLGIITTHSIYNHDKMKDIIDFSIKNLSSDNITIVLDRSLDGKKSYSDEFMNHYKENVNFLFSYANKGELGTFNVYSQKLMLAARRMMYEVVYKTINNKTYQIPCYAGKMNIVIDEHGNVGPCEMLDRCGNIRDFDYDLKKLVSSDGFKKVVRDIKETKCFCSHECYLATSILVDPMNLLQVLKSYFFKKGPVF
ncbi:radical SAM protein [bacterium]|nr:radical SAM protein [bacterium]